jgi:hypothetical protein
MDSISVTSAALLSLGVTHDGRGKFARVAFELTRNSAKRAAGRSL